VLVQAALAVVGTGEGEGVAGRRRTTTTMTTDGASGEERVVKLTVLARNETEDDENVEVLISRQGSEHTAIVTRPGRESEAFPSLTVASAIATTSNSSTSSPTAATKKTLLTTLFPTHRVTTTVVQTTDPLTATARLAVFQDGRRADLVMTWPTWMAEVLGSQGLAGAAASGGGGVVAPMPCKILRNEVAEGDEVDRGAALVV
jgi:3-methylcrotonyl-CoA carboxylase alpha subunit